MLNFRPFTVLLFLFFFLLISGCTQASEQSSESSPLSQQADVAPTHPSPSATAGSDSPLESVTPTATPPPSQEAGSNSLPAPAVTATPTEQPTQTPAPTPTPGATAAVSDQGALIQISLAGQVGVLLDEFPDGMRERVATAVLDQAEADWIARAERQIRLSRLRLNFRDARFPDRGQLPLPPSTLWSITLDPAGPVRQTYQGHDYVLIGYTFSSTLLTNAASVDQSEPALSAIGGTWTEPFVFPLDPDLLLQRTGKACINEGGFPPESYDSENAWHFFDYECTADSGGALGCHRTILANFSCREALAAFVGEVDSAFRFERVPWDEALAARVRLGPVTSLDTPDLMVVGEDIGINRIIYRFIEPDDCALEEGAVGASGWRRLLQFEATIHNVGAEALHIGPVVSEDPVNHVFDYNACHDHFHYSNYGDFFIENLEQLTGSKQAFCVQSTSRYSNNEASPLIHPYSCSFQGIEAGWVDEYIAGLDAQWIDITDLEVAQDGQTIGLGFTSNQDRFLCEGTPVVDASGVRLWEPTEFTTVEGNVINRPQCEFIPDWDANNEETHDVFVPQTGSFVTLPCASDEMGPLRNCGFAELSLADADMTCQPGEQIQLRTGLAATDPPQVLRACQWSAELGTGVACTYEDSIVNAIIDGQTDVTFTCPAVRDAEDGDAAGRYALYAAPVWPEDQSPPVLLEEND